MMYMCRVVCCIVRRGCLLWTVCSLDKTLLAFPLLHFVLQSQTFFLFWESFDLLLLHSIPLWRKWHCFLVSVLEDAICLHRTSQFQLPWHQYLGYWLGVLWYWIVCLGKELGSFCNFENAPKYWIWGSFVDYEDYSISSKGFFSTVVDIMVTRIKFVHSCPF